MTSKLSVADVMANLESRAAFHREQEAIHGTQEAKHREERIRHAEELRKIVDSLESFRTAAALALEMTQAPPPAPPATGARGPEIRIPPSGRLMVSRLVRLVVAGREGGESFGAGAVAAEVNRRFADRLHHAVDPRTVSDVLRRMHQAHQIHLVRPGKAFSEAFYRSGARPRQEPAGE
jgi:hypothetical protein